jgi:hypothetical protein
MSSGSLANSENADKLISQKRRRKKKNDEIQGLAEFS